MSSVSEVVEDSANAARDAVCLVPREVVMTLADLLGDRLIDYVDGIGGGSAAGRGAVERRVPKGLSGFLIFSLRLRGTRLPDVTSGLASLVQVGKLVFGGIHLSLLSLVRWLPARAGRHGSDRGSRDAPSRWRDWRYLLRARVGD